jgi:hypothetical protein
MQPSPQAPRATVHFPRRFIARWANRHLCRILAPSFLLALAGSTGMHAQLSGGALPGSVATRYNPPSVQPTGHSLPMKDASGTEDQRILQMRNAARQLSMVSDAGKLLRLASELHAEVAANNTSSLTPAQLRKIQQIEKLAHKVRIEMAISVSDTEGGMMPIQTLGFN